MTLLDGHVASYFKGGKQWDAWVRLWRFEVHLWRQNLGIHLAFHWRTT